MPKIESAPARPAEGQAPKIEPRKQPVPSAEDTEDAGPSDGFLQKRRSPAFLAFAGPLVAMSVGKTLLYAEQNDEGALRQAVRVGLDLATVAEEELEAHR